jgi:hypothetical protein
VFQLKRISDHGTANPIVARLSVQNYELLQFCSLGKEVREQILSLCHVSIQPRLLECDEIAQKLANETLTLAQEWDTNGAKLQSQGRVVEVPHVIRLEQQAENFLYCAKSVLRDLLKIFNLCFGAEFSEARYDQALTWAQTRFGADSEIARLIKQDHDLWIKRLVSMRNAVEHPDGYSGRLHIHNIELVEMPLSPLKITEPSWHLNEEPKASIVSDMLAMVSNMLELCEDFVVFCIRTNGFPPMLEIVEIPESNRSASCAVRLKVMPAGNLPFSPASTV